jgi:beta-1,4-mannooligosaccharide/beta-1,4-mannosyl-N-acetylglucosamine phosphorylase
MKRSLQNPIITRRDIPAIEPCLVDVSSVFNPGAARFEDQIALILRVQNRGRETFLLTAFSDDGTDFTISDDPVRLLGIELVDLKIFHIYDPRITCIGGTYYLTLAMDTDVGCRLGLAKTTDFETFEFLGILLDEDARNAVIFPDKIDGRYAMLYRPNRDSAGGGVASGGEIHIAYSNDLLRWEPRGMVMQGRFHYWDELIGSGAAPIKTHEGWLHVYHGVATHFAASNIYQAGVVLLDLEYPERVIARSRYNILEPRELYELTGQVPNVVFPTGLVPLRPDLRSPYPTDTELLLYYGAADTCVGLATTSVADLLAACHAGESDG